METVGGYRLLRKLGEGGGAEVSLGHAGTVESPDRDRIAAIKVFRPSAAAESIDAEIDALARCSSRHILELRDLASGPGGRPCLILPPLGSASLARFLAVRSGIRTGEAVTAIIPIIDAVEELHRVGIAHN